jgi:DNA repair protein RecO (recombination protein O)
MALSETEALVLRTYNLAEADKIVVCLTHGNGLIRGVAKGCRRLKNRFGAALEPFTLLQLSFYQKENHELVSLGQTEILKSHFNLFRDAEILAGLSYMAELIIDFSPPYQKNEKLFRMLKACLEAVAVAPANMQMIQRYFEVWLLKLEGFLPDIKLCGDCQRPFNDAEITFMGSDLQLRCRTCSHGQGTPLSVKVQRQLRATEKLGPNAFANASHEVSPVIMREIGDLTHQLILRVLERQPRLRPSYR